MDKNYKFLVKNQISDLVSLSSYHDLVKWKWVYRKNTKENGLLKKYKARLVAQGFQHIHVIDYDETFSLVATVGSIQLILAIVVARRWEVH